VLVIVVGWKYVDTSNWTVHPRQRRPRQVRLEGVLRGAAMVFFAYIGFEAVSVAAQESKNPQRDMPIGMMLSLVICTVLYIAMAAGADRPGAVPAAGHRRAGGDRRGRASAAGLAALGGRGRRAGRPVLGGAGDDHRPAAHLHDHGRDGLLPPVFTKIHPSTAPHINTVITGIGIALLAALFPLDILGELTSMGTLIAFAAVCAGVLILRRTQPDLPRPFRIRGVARLPGRRASCLALLSAMTLHNWLLMLGWTAIGLLIYAGYGYRRSRLNPARPTRAR
jgi:APA family basic amino acid/polyamine antiporter